MRFLWLSHEFWNLDIVGTKAYCFHITKSIEAVQIHSSDANLLKECIKW